ncbi:hypothetical protein FRACYDRAFT_244770 [Fragilariopsis cylindrus CCMP1102]|uniref:Uncharacterized protein n=1 Tax=Fragilariopsis cylindrus CCMP1102 TaxID=635003 RepID=A0A1E7F0C9_9STRA|nr:hypothetical protein FRACYDRAFT_244770 [Fragilariopsis cylindrus CCMP1102]|eukprot:OEU11652.1 hypothetical protein FRACYDRAFT_244770 [Fragilariopsis cylindrus CCMP1102]
MDDHPNIDNNEDDEQQQEAQADEQENIDAAAAIAAAAAAAAAAETKQRHLKIDSVLERKEKFPFRNRKKIDGLIKEFLEKFGYAAAAIAAAATKQRHLKIDSVLARKGKFPLRNRKKINVLIEEFLVKLEDDIHDMFFENELDEADIYVGLDSDRDTEDEVETAIRFFPEVLSRGKPFFPEGILYYPIQELAVANDAHNDDGIWQCNVKTVSFIPIVARLAIEFDSFEEDKRGGLLCLDRDGDYVLHLLMLPSETLKNLGGKYRAIDDKYLQVLIQLRKLGLLKKEDIQRYNLLHYLCGVRGEDYSTEKRLRFLVEWDPNALTQADRFGQLPLDLVGSIQGFQVLFEYGIRYFPKKKGISFLFHKPNSLWLLTTFQYACNKFGGEKVKKSIEDTLVRYSSSTPINSADALLSAAIDETVHLDGVYFLLRREPDMLHKLLSSLPSASTSTSTAVADCDININCINDTTDEVNSRKEKDRKRKRCIIS